MSEASGIPFVFVLSLLFAGVQFVIALRLYEPPGEEATPVLEAVVMFVGFFLLYVLIGRIFAYLAGISPWGRLALGGIALFGLYSMHSIREDDVETATEATQAMGMAFSVSMIAYVVVALLVG